MATLSTELRNKLEKTCIAARNLAERAAKAALEALAVAHHEPYGHMIPAQRGLRNKLRARARQVGDAQDAKRQLSLTHLVHECAYEHWHRMLFARFLAENNLLIEPDMGVAVSLEECKELAKAAKTDLWTLAGRYAQKMLPEIFRADDPVLQVPLAREDQLKLEQFLDALAKDTFTAGDGLGWCYQFWQAEHKEIVNKSGKKIGADELPAVTQLFTEDYMVDFLLDNTLGAWHAGKVLAANSRLGENAKSEEELRRAVSLPGCPWNYLRFIKNESGNWTPAAGTFDGWPKTAMELTCLDPCMGSGHFIVAMFERLVALRIAEEKLDEVAAVAAVIRDNLFGLEIDPRCTQIAAFNLAMAAWRRVGHCPLPAMNLACSGLGVNASEADWLKIAGNNKRLERGMQQLYQLFRQAPVLGSLINPCALGGYLFNVDFHELQPLLEQAIRREKMDDAHELAVTAQGVAKAAEILAGQFTLVATNVPYLGLKKMEKSLRDFCESNYQSSKADLAAVFSERSLDFCKKGGSIAVVSPQTITFLGTFVTFRINLLKNHCVNILARLGIKAFQAMMYDFTVSMWVATRLKPSESATFCALDLSEFMNAAKKSENLGEVLCRSLAQSEQLRNPDSRITVEELGTSSLLDQIAISPRGVVNGDIDKWLRSCWEVEELTDDWRFLHTAVTKTEYFDGCHQIIDWSTGGEGMLRPGLGNKAYGKLGVAVSRMAALPSALYLGELYDQNTSVLVPYNAGHLSALWAYCSSQDFNAAVRKLDQKVGVTPATLLKIPFDLAHWQKVAAEKYPNGLPKPFSSDPTQWLFNGHPKGSDWPLQVAVARLLGYAWPRQTGSSFPDCPALGPDGLDKLADDDGIVCIPSVRGEEPAAERLRKLLAAAYDVDWKPNSELELLHAAGSNAGDLDEWLRNEFFEQHCGLFHHRPFIWHIWDGRKRDGFHALVNYHTLASGDKGRRTLESLTHSYLGDWITRQKDSQKRGEEAADERLAAALALKEKLEAILTGEPPYDIFVRWKPLSQQAIGWHPDVNDGVRMNIRPFLASDIPGGKKGAGILRAKPNIKWDKDRGNEPKREKSDFPWFWKDGAFTGERLNDVHLTKEQKEKARNG